MVARALTATPVVRPAEPSPGVRRSLVLAVIVIVATACTPAAPAPQPTEVARQGGRVVEAIDSEPKTLLPLFEGTDSRISRLLYEPLARWDAQSGAIVQGLGTWTISADGRTYSVTLAAKASWSDGRPVIAEDYVTWVRAVARSKKATKDSWRNIVGFDEFLEGKAAEIRGIRGDPANPKRMTVEFAEAFCQVVTNFTTPLLPTHVFGRFVGPNAGDEIDRAAEQVGTPVTNGPFVFREWHKGDEIVLARNPDYWQGAPLLDEYVFKIASEATAVEQLPRGAVTLRQNVKLASIPGLEREERLRVHRLPINSFTFIGWNTQSQHVPGLRDRRVRQALAYGLDWRLAIERIWGGAGARQLAHHPSSHWVYPGGLNEYAYDAAKAEELLRFAGYARGSDGVYGRGEEKLAFSIATNEGNKEREALLQFAQDQYARIGVRITPRLMKFADLSDRLSTGAEDIDAFILGWADVLPDPNYSRRLWHSSQIGAPGRPGTNVARYQDPRVDAALDRGRGPDCSTEARRSAYGELDRILNEEQPVNFGVNVLSFAVTSGSLQGLDPGPHDFYKSVHQWWLAR